MGRTAARESLFKLVYEYSMRNERNDLTANELCRDLAADDVMYLQTAYDGIVSKSDELRRTIGKYSQGFALDRIYKIDLAILMVAIYEIVYCDDIPDSVSANEATELAKKYSTDKSYSFVNGVLASVIKEKDHAGENH